MSTVQQQLRPDWLGALYGKGWLTINEMLGTLGEAGIKDHNYHDLKTVIPEWENRNFIERDVLVKTREEVYRITRQANFYLECSKILTPKPNNETTA